MDYVIQLAEKKHISKFKKSLVFVLFLLVLAKSIFSEINKYFGLDEMEIIDRIMWYGFYLFCSLAILICYVITHLGI